MTELLDTIVSPETQAKLAVGTVITIGNFDGVHRGHQSIIQDVTNAAHAKSALSVALTFEPHPAELFTEKTADEYRITNNEERIQLLERYGIDRVITVPFTKEFAELPPETFVVDFLVNRLHAIEIHIGYDFAFGKGRAGNTRSLQSLCDAHGVHVVVHDAVAISEAPISSTRVREHLRAGNVHEAAALLGHLYTITGHQVAGAERGREMGIPTINLHPEGRMLPKNGVYATLVRLADSPLWHRSITNVGTRPTFETDASVNIETHVLGKEIQCHLGDPVALSFVDYIRAEQQFESSDELRQQIGQDISIANSAHATYLGKAQTESIIQPFLDFPFVDN